MTARPARLCVLVSGRGRNLQVIHAACADGRIPAEICGVISNRPGALALRFAEEAGIGTTLLDHTTFGSRESFDAELAKAVHALQPDWIVLAGFMRRLSPVFVTPLAGRMLNIHPSLLPRHRGLHTHRAVLQAGEREHGASVHFVTEALDGGPVLIQGTCSVHADDDEQSLAQRVLESVELHIYPQAIAWLAQGRVRCEDEQVHFDGAPLSEPLTLDHVEDPFQ